MAKKVLIADDEVLVRRLLAQMLEDLEAAGVEVLEAGNGTDTWRIIQTEHPDLVILDVMMPEPSGYEICERIKADPGLCDIYVIILSARGQAIDRQRGLDAGADEYVVKPFDPARLVKRTADALGTTLSG